MVGLVCIFMVFGLTLNSLATEYPSITLRVTSAYPSATFANKLLHWFMEDVKEATAGKIKFQEYWGGSLLKGREILEGVEHGVTDLALLCPPIIRESFRSPTAITHFLLLREALQ